MPDEPHQRAPVSGNSDLAPLLVDTTVSAHPCQVF
ncbi:hypothetical protein J2045_001939 [Peteryoungia aggregata LMG 23059]|uniref:Uncharacterized protein n=1 Tax=Peteryoungia aggregata LMG 23059 TaxID=1368425 RepID=A0ABU0G6G5_9HYPH|nr:hypothetical protein [Peteryoungia aggregata LMG 23059]